MDRIVDCLRDRLDLFVDEIGEKHFVKIQCTCSIICIQECDCTVYIVF
jgi:hypothetical protein